MWFTTGTKEMVCRQIVGFLVGLFSFGTWCQGQQDPTLLELLKTAVWKALDVRGAPALVQWDWGHMPVPQFTPIKGLDNPSVVPFLVDVLYKDPQWPEEMVRMLGGAYFLHAARCYVALCLGWIGDPEAFLPLIDTLKHGEFRQGKYWPVPPSLLEEINIRDYAAYGLGFLGDPNAVEPLIDALLKDGVKGAVYGLAWLKDLKAIRPIAEYIGKDEDKDYLQGWKDYQFKLDASRCLLYISGARMREEGKGDVFWTPDFPDMGQVVGFTKFKSAWWLYWLTKGDRVARAQFEINYARLLAIRKQNPRDLVSQSYCFYEMFRMGVLTLPYAMEAIEAGDDSLIPHVYKLTAPPSPRHTRHRSALPPNATRQQCLNWWQANKDKWLMKFRSAEDKASEKAQSDPKDPN